METFKNRFLFVTLNIVLAIVMSTTAVNSEDYIIGVEDNLFVSVWDNEKLTMSLTVRPDGKVSFPLLDDIQAAGKTSLELRDDITGRLKDFISSPDVTVIVTNVNSRKIFIFGQVNRPGVYSVSRDTSLLHLVSVAGGLTGKEDLKAAKLIRKNSSVKTDFFSLIEEGELSQNISLEADDIVYIPDNYKNRISVLGEVNRPGAVSFKPGLTLLDAILLSGGITEYSNSKKTRLVRKKRHISGISRNKIKKGFSLMGKKNMGQRVGGNIQSGSRLKRKMSAGINLKKVKQRKIINIKKNIMQGNPHRETRIINLDKIMKDGDISKNVLLKPGDIIIVPKSLF